MMLDNSQIVKHNFGMTLSELTAQGFTVRMIAEALGLSVQAVHTWGDTVPVMRESQLQETKVQNDLRQALMDSRCGFLYLIEHSRAPSVVKIGWTKDHPSKRLVQFQTASADLLVLAHVVGGSARMEERVLHLRFAAYRRRATSEWFDDTDGLIRVAFKAMEQDWRRADRPLMTPDDIAGEPMTISTLKRRGITVRMIAAALRLTPAAVYHWGDVLNSVQAFRVREKMPQILKLLAKSKGKT